MVHHVGGREAESQSGGLSVSPEDSEAARKLFAQSCDFVRACSEVAQFPPSTVPEVAFIGRSNVGKSSLINGLTGRKALARASKTPGRTQQIIFFDLVQRLMLVDLPGYGHAEAPREDQGNWNELVRRYLQTRPPLRVVCLLIDGRHGVLAKDLTMMEFLDRTGTSYQIVLTKIDQVHTTEREKRCQQVTAMLPRHPAARPTVLAVSSEKNIGLEELRGFLAGFAVAPSV